eukprot:Skav224410  [mRNA]  locus=scaffold657:112489:113511:+ [translate_table: standard]
MPQKDLQPCCWHAYLDAIRKPGAWASDVEICALSEAFAVNVTILHGTSVKTFSVNEPRGHVWLQLTKGHFCCLDQGSAIRKVQRNRKWQWIPSVFRGNPCNWRGGSARATRRKKTQKQAIQALKNVKLPRHMSAFAPLIPMLIDFLANCATSDKPSKRQPRREKKKQRKEQDDAKQEKQQDKPECWYFKHGMCRFGDKCHYAHVHPPSPAKPSSPPAKEPITQWELRPSDWNATIYTVNNFSNLLDHLDISKEQRAIAKIDQAKDKETVSELLEQLGSQTKLQVACVQPCHNPPIAVANGMDVVFAPVRISGILKPRAVVLHSMTDTCAIRLHEQKMRQA